MSDIKGQGFTAVVKGDKLLLEIDLNAPRIPSASGKTSVIASSRGAIPVAAKDGVFNVNLNVYTK